MSVSIDDVRPLVLAQMGIETTKESGDDRGEVKENPTGCEDPRLPDMRFTAGGVPAWWTGRQMNRFQLPHLQLSTEFCRLEPESDS